MEELTRDLKKYRIMIGLKNDDTSSDASILIHLERAEKRVVKARHPFGCTELQRVEALDVYSENVDSLFLVLYNKIGAEGESSHNDNVASRSYEDENKCLSDIVPYAKIL